MPRVEKSVDLDALSHNFSVVRRLVGPDVSIMPMIKANAYGHDLLDVATQLNAANAFGVATLIEAVRLRGAGITQPIFVMCGFQNLDELTVFSTLSLTAVVHHKDQIDWLESATLDQPISIWLKLDTGMHRLGVAPDCFFDSHKRLSQTRNAKQPIGLMTHFANADADSVFTKKQLDCFEQYTGSLDNPKSAANSAGIIKYQESHYQLVRPGLMLYGVSPFSDKTGAELGLKPLMTLTSSLISYKLIKAGDKVGYGSLWEASQDAMLGIVSAGYGDGYPRHVQNGAPVLVDDVICPVVGRISMDMLAIDISAIKAPYIGQPVTLWGDSLPIESVAAAADTIPYELLCQLTERVIKKVFV